MIRIVGVVATLVLVAGLMWREAVAVDAVAASHARRRLVSAVLVTAAGVFAVTVTATLAAML